MATSRGRRTVSRVMPAVLALTRPLRPVVHHYERVEDATVNPGETWTSQPITVPADLGLANSIDFEARIETSNGPHWTFALQILHNGSPWGEASTEAQGWGISRFRHGIYRQPGMHVDEPWANGTWAYRLSGLAGDDAIYPWQFSLDLTIME